MATTNHSTRTAEDTVLDVSSDSKTQAGSPKTSECPSCNSVLITRTVTPGQSIRCGRCSQIIRFGTTEKVATDKLAWRSLWLGVASLVFLFFTGIPAVYYGIRSLLRMRFFRPKTSDRAAAVVGTTLGGCMGVFVGIPAAFTGLMIAIVVLTVTSSEIPAEIEEELAKHCNVSFPEDVEGVGFQSLMLGSQQTFDFADAKKRDERKIDIRIIRYNTTLAVNKMAIILRAKTRGVPEGEMISQEVIEWRAGREPIEVNKRVYRVKNKTSDDETPEKEFGTVNHYYGVFAQESDYIGFVIVLHVDDRSMEDSELEAFWKLVDARASEDPQPEQSVSPSVKIEIK